MNQEEFSKLYGDVDNHTPVFKIFNYYFEVQIPASFGNQNTRELLGDPEYESKVNAELEASALVSKRHTIAELVELNDSGCRIILLNPKDSVKIYTIIQDYLKKRRTQIKYSLDIGEVNLTDLAKLDSFAKVVYNVARQYDKIGLGESNVTRNLNSLYGSRRFKSRELDPVPTEEEAPMRKEHNSILGEISHDAIVRELPYR